MMDASEIVINYHPRGAARDIFKMRDPELILSGPAGCVAGETRLYDPVKNEHIAIKDLYLAQRAPTVQTLWGPVQAEIPFRKGIARLYRVTTTSGHSCLVTGNHRFLTPHGWTFASECSSGESILVSVPVHQERCLGQDHIASRQDVVHLTNKEKDCQDGYLQYSHRCDVLPQWEAKNDQVFVPLRDGVLLRSRVDWQMDDRVYARGRNPQASRSSSHLSMQDYSLHSVQMAYAQNCALQENQPHDDGWFQCVAQSLKGKHLPLPIGKPRLCDDNMHLLSRHLGEYPVSSDGVEPVGMTLLPLQPSSLHLMCGCTMQESLAFALALDAYNLSMLTSNQLMPPSKCNYMVQWGTVSSVEYERTDEYFDLHVPGAEHYLAEGIWHHNTGKSRSILEKLHLAALKYPNARLLMLRKTHRSLTESGMVTYWEKIRPDLDGVQWKPSMQQYQYPNGAILAVGGLDRAQKIMSSEWDLIYCQECTELSEDDWEACTIRLRNNIMPYQQLLGDCNPDAPTHWARQRANSGRTIMLESRHEDNPVLFSDNGEITNEGKRYLGTLESLTGVRLARYRYGIWSSAEGTVYEQEWDRNRNVIDKYPLDRSLPRYLAVDFGFSHPFVCLWAALDNDGRIIIYRQIYRTKKLVEDHAKDIAIASGWFHLLPKDHPKYKPRPADWADPLPREIICDHAIEDRRTLERHLGLYTIPAKKSVTDGIQAVAARLRPAGDGKPRLMIMRDSLVERDQDLAQAKKPTCLEEEPDSYVWKQDSSGVKDEPVKESDHALDCVRYLCSFFDLTDNAISYFRGGLWK